MTSRSVSTRRFGLTAAAGLALVALTAAACGGDDNGGKTPARPASSPVATAPAATPTRAAAPTAATQPTTAATTTAATQAPTAAPTTAAQPTAAATVSLGAAGLVDSRRFSLYVFANDTAGSGTSACTAGCASAWPPLTAGGPLTAGAGVTGELGTMTRADGTVQVTYNGLPLYFFANDQAPGDTNGKDIPNWSLAQP